MVSSPSAAKTVLRIDLYHQYAPFFQELYKKLTTGDTIVYSLFSGLGNNFLCNFFNYLCSPFSLLIFLFGERYITEAIACMILIKCMLSSASFCYYLKKSQNHYGYYSAAFSVLYSLCAYFTAYYWNVMWMDAMYLFPLVMLGLESIVKHGRWKLYLFSLAAAIITGYYIAFMICIFSVMYFIVCFINSHRVFSRNGIKKFFSRSLTFGLSSIGAAGLACFMLIPMLFGLSTSSATNGSFPTTVKTYFNLIEFLSGLLPGVEPTVRSSAELVTPNIFCGTIIVILLPLYYMSSKISRREKITHSVLLVILYLSFNLNILNYIWHGFHFPKRSSVPAVVPVQFSAAHHVLQGTCKYTRTQTEQALSELFHSSVFCDHMHSIQTGQFQHRDGSICRRRHRRLFGASRSNSQLRVYAQVFGMFLPDPCIS